MGDQNRRDIMKLTAAASMLGVGTATAQELSEEGGLKAPLRKDLPGFLRLIANENPYGPGPKARDALLNAFDEAHRYAIRPRMALEKMIAEREGVTSKHIISAAGSGEILTMMALNCALSGKKVISAETTFEMLQPYAEKAGADVIRVPLDADYTHDLEAMAAAVTAETGLVYICNPNNPTGTMVDAEKLRDFCRSMPKDVVVLIDEAYLELIDDPASQTMVPLLEEGANVIVTRTFSKLHGMAGLRIGFAMAQPELIETITGFRMSIPNTLGLRAAIASYNDFDFLSLSKQKIIEGRQMIYDVFSEVGLTYTPSHGNFVFFDSGRPAGDFSAAMRGQNVLMRGVGGFERHCRISVGTIEQMFQFQQAVRNVMA